MTKRTRRRTVALIAALALALTLLPPSPPAEAVIPVIDGANLTENLKTAIQTYLAIGQRVSMLANQVRQIEAALQELKHLDHPLADEIGWLFYDLAALLRETEGLVYSLDDLDERVRDLFPGYEPAEDDLAELYSDRTHATLETLRAALLSTQRMARSLGPTQQTVAALTEQALGAQGNLQALQANSVLVGFTAQQISRLLQQVAVLTNAQAVYDSNAIEREASAAATYEGWIDDSRREAAPYDSGTQFALVPPSYPW
jgi:type IV secretion system protein TrbJ